MRNICSGNKLRRVAGALLLASLLVSGCGGKQADEAPLPLVRAQQAVPAAASTVQYSGTVRGRYETNLSFQVGGQILSRNVEAGSRVQPGQTLMVIDARDVVQQATSGDAQVAQARAQLDLAQSNLARYTELYQQDVVPQATLEQYQTNYDAAFASYQAALAQAAQGHNAVSYTNLIAGAPGVISEVKAEEGQVVSAGQTVMTLVQTGEMEVEISVPESQIAGIQAGLPVEVSFWALSAQVDGTVREVSPMADAASRTYKVRVSLPAPPEGLQLGMTASVSCGGAAEPEGGSETMVSLPLSAIYQTGEEPQVWLVEDGEVHLKTVEVTEFGDNAVLVKGLSPSDTVVTAGVHKLHEGEQVRVAGPGEGL